MLYKHFIAWNCNGCSIASPSPVISTVLSFKNCQTKINIFGNGCDERIYIDLRDSYGYEKPTRTDSKGIQKGGFLPPIAGLIARPILASIAGSLGTKLLGCVAEKFMWRKKKKI